MYHETLDPAEVARVQAFVVAERHKCLSDREWQFRLQGYGYDVRKTESGHIVTDMFKKADLLALDEADLMAGRDED